MGQVCWGLLGGKGREGGPLLATPRDQLGAALCRIATPPTGRPICTQGEANVPAASSCISPYTTEVPHTLFNDIATTSDVNFIKLQDRHILAVILQVFE